LLSSPDPTGGPCAIKVLSSSGTMFYRLRCNQVTV